MKKSKLPLRFSVFALVVLFGLYIGWQIGSAPSAPEPPEEVLTRKSTVKDPVLPGSRFADWQPTPEKPRFRYPEGAVEGEVVLTFKDRQAYLDYLAALEAAGLRPLGRIDALGVLRLETSVLSRLKAPLDSVEASFNFRISRPVPPEAARPVAMLNLAPYNLTASQISGAREGDGSGVLVAVLDSGLSGHKTFEGVDIEELVLAGEHLDDPGAEHGTAVASIIGGKEGVAPGSSLLIVRVLDEDGLGHSFHAAEGIIHAVESGAQIINLSLGLYENSALLRHAVQYADERGVLMVASAGNDSYASLPYPAAYREVLAVTAVDARQRQAGFPNQSEEIDVAAPGVAILSAQGEGDSQLFTGTSAAAPFVSGTLAVLISRNPLRPAEQAIAELKQRLNDSGALGPDPLYGGGWIDWSRLGNTGQAALSDIALADIHLPADALPGTTVPVEILIQNRGNQWLSGGELTVELSGDSSPQAFTLRSTRPGEAFSQRIFAPVPPAHSSERLRIGAVVRIDEPGEDAVPENNFKIMEVQPLP